GHGEGFFIISFTTTLFTRYVHIRQETHLHFDLTLPSTSLTPPTFDVERKATRLIAFQSCFRQQRKQFSHLIPETNIRSRYRTRRFPNRRLIDFDHPLDWIDSLYTFMQSCTTGERTHFFLESFNQNFLY